MSGDLLLALDLGTTGVRALIVAAEGGVRARAYLPLETAFPAPGRVEQDPDELWESSVRVMQSALAEAGVRAEDLAGIGVVTQRATVIAWDARDGRPLAPAVVWQDTRTAERVGELRAQGIPITTLASATKLAWWLEHEPALQKAAGAGTLRYGTPDTWLSYRLTEGVAHVTDPGQASCTGLFDPQTGAFSEPLCALFGAAHEPLAEVVASSTVVGETSPRLLGAAVPVAARAGDQQASAFGQGVHAPGEAKLTLGTSAMMDLHTGGEPAAPLSGAFPLALWTLADGARAFCLEGQVVTAGAAVDWAVTLGIAESPSQLDALAAEVSSSEGVVFVPALQGLGTPHGEDAARALFAGLTRGSSRAHLARALLDGVAHRCAELADALGVEGRAIRVDGGLGRSALLVQTIADLSGCELQLCAETEATALGAAWLAGLATGVYATPAECLATLSNPRSFAPTLAPARRAEERARFQRAIGRARLQ